MHDRRDDQSARAAFGQARALALAAALGLVTTVSTFACNEAPQFTAHRAFTSTVTLAHQTALELRTVIPATATGVPRLSEVHVKVDLTVTASSSTRAKAIADDLALTVDRTDARLGLLLDHPDGATLSGSLSMEAPADLALQIVDYGGTVAVSGFTGDIAVGTTSGVQITGATKNTTVEVGSGYALIDTLASPGSLTSVKVTSGGIELALPEGLSAAIQASTQSGQISISHPRLPPYVSGTGLPYTANVGGGLAVVRLQTGAGNIVIRTR